MRKPKKLTVKQAALLERNFEFDRKLGSERKLLLARELDLQPRQVIVWFQNKRARWRAKQLEEDYKALSKQYFLLKAKYEALIQEKETLEYQVRQLKQMLHISYDKQKEGIAEETKVSWLDICPYSPLDKEGVNIPSSELIQDAGAYGRTENLSKQSLEELKINQQLCNFDKMYTNMQTFETKDNSQFLHHSDANILTTESYNDMVLEDLAAARVSCSQLKMQHTYEPTYLQTSP
eukprot:c26147_g1_i2 orf=176-880(+)